MTIIKKLALCALALSALAGSAHAAAPAPAPASVPAPTPLSRTEMTNIRGEGSSTYISYGALGKNGVPCSRKGSSYTNCQPGAEANPYTRGCSVSSRCARQ